MSCESIDRSRGQHDPVPSRAGAEIATPRDTVSSDSSWALLGSLGRALVNFPGKISLLASSSNDPRAPRGRQRDIFPLLPMGRSEALEISTIGEVDACDACAYINGVILALNFLYGIHGEIFGDASKRSAAQKEVLKVIVGAAIGLHDHLQACLPFDGDRTWSFYEPGIGVKQLELCADAVDIPDVAGTCDPLSVVHKDVAARLSDVCHVFRQVPASLNRFTTFYAGDRVEYIKLTVRQLRACLLCLSSSCKGGGTVFPVGKSGNRQRAVWHGSRVSAAAESPPKPRLLADPSVFRFLRLADCKKLRVTKRDCRCWFDQLVLPACLRPFMGRPRVSYDDLKTAGMLDSEIIGCLADDVASGCKVFWPLPCTWPMGFSWSSYVAQETLLSIAEESGLSEDMALAPGTPIPSSLDAAFALATDDLMLFSDVEGRTLELARTFESSLARHGAVKHAGKDIDDATDATCLGVDLSGGTHWWPPPAKLCQMMYSISDLARHRFASPAGVASYLGVAQWLDLLQRLKLSIFERVYTFAKRAEDCQCKVMPEIVVEELLLDIVLVCFNTVDMRKEFLPFLGATDASTYGHGAAVAPCSLKELERIAHLHVQGGGLVLLDGAPELPCVSIPDNHIVTALGLGDFEVVLSVRTCSNDHINLQEACALIRYVRWVLRSSQRFSYRIVVLIDSRVVLGAVTKGRSSKIPLNRLIKRLAALVFAGGLVLHLVYVPSSHNPSDPPSRGGPASWPPELRRSTRLGTTGGVRRERKQAKHIIHQKLDRNSLDECIEEANVVWSRFLAIGAISLDSSSDVESEPSSS